MPKAVAARKVMREPTAAELKTNQQRYGRRHPGRVARDDGAFAFHASRVMRVLPWIEDIQTKTRTDLTSSSDAPLRPWPPVHGEVRASYEYLIGPGQARSGSASRFNPFLELLGAEALFRNAANAGALPQYTEGLVTDDMLERWCAKQVWANPPLPLFRAALDSVFAIRQKGSIDQAEFEHAFGPLQAAILDAFTDDEERRADNGTEVNGVRVSPAICAVFAGAATLFPYVVLRVNEGGRPEEQEFRIFHRYVTALFAREPDLGTPGPVDFAYLSRAFEIEPERDHDRTRKLWTDRIPLIEKPGRAAER